MVKYSYIIDIRRPERGLGAASGSCFGLRPAASYWERATGRFLRRSRLDEVPQLWNVLKGDMSFVGPRPPLRLYVERFPELYAKVLQSRPGVTGLATLVFHRHEEKLLAACRSAAETDAVYARRCVPRKARIDLIYQNMLSEWLVDPHEIAVPQDWKSVWDNGWAQRRWSASPRPKSGFAMPIDCKRILVSKASNAKALAHPHPHLYAQVPKRRPRRRTQQRPGPLLPAEEPNRENKPHERSYRDNHRHAQEYSSECAAVCRFAGRLRGRPSADYAQCHGQFAG